MWINHFFGCSNGRIREFSVHGVNVESYSAIFCWGSADVDISIDSPSSAPTVLDDPFSFRISNKLYGMVQIIRNGTLCRAASHRAFGCGRSVVNNFISSNCQNHRPLKKHGNQAIIVFADCSAKVSDKVCCYVGFVVSHVGSANICIVGGIIVRVCRFKGKTIAQSNGYCRVYVTSLTSKACVVTLEQVLLSQVDWICRLLTSDQFALQQWCSSESPAWTTAFLVLDRCNHSKRSPVKRCRFCHCWHWDLL